MRQWAFSYVTIVCWEASGNYYVSAVDPNDAQINWTFIDERMAVEFFNRLKDLTMGDWAAATLLDEERWWALSST